MRLLTNLTRNQCLQLVLILILSSLLIVPGLTQGAEYLLIPEESSRTAIAFRMVETKDLNPHWFSHPASLVIYLLASVYYLAFKIGSFLGVFGSFTDFENLWYFNPSFFVISGRILARLFGLISVFLIYFVFRKLVSGKYRLLLVFLVSINPIFVTHSHRLRMDNLLTMFFILFLGVCFEIVEDRQVFSYIKAGIISGLAIAVKYTAGIFIPITLIGSFLSSFSIKKAWKNFSIFMGVTSIALLVSSPYLFLEWQTAKIELTDEVTKSEKRNFWISFFDSFSDIMLEIIPRRFSFIGLAMIIMGVVFCAISKNKKEQISSIFFILFLVLISLPSTVNETWIIPVIPLSSYFMVKFINTIAENKSILSNFQRLKKYTLIFCVVLISLFMFAKDFKVVSSRLKTTSHEITRQWIINNIPQDSSIVLDALSPALPRDRYKLYRAEVGKLEQICPHLTCGKHYNAVVTWHSDIREIDIQTLRKNKIQYLVFNNKLYKDGSRQAKEQYKKLFKSGLLLIQDFSNVLKGEPPWGDYGNWGAYKIYKVLQDT